jgi:hypothetical protein
MADISSYIQYFQSLAEKHKKILHSSGAKHFFLMDINELLSSTNSTIKYPAIVLLKLSGKVIDKKEDNTLFSIEGGFLVLDHCKKIDDFATELQIFQETFSIGMEIVSRIKYDQQACELLSLKAIPDFDSDQVRWEMIGPVFENHFGIMFRFPVNLLADLEHNPSLWT